MPPAGDADRTSPEGAPIPDGGPSGPSGPSGSSGPSGPSGPSGSSGPSSSGSSSGPQGPPTARSSRASGRPRTAGAGGAGPKPPGLAEQWGRARDAVWRLIGAHLALARAEFAAIGAEIQQVAALVGAAVGLVIFMSLVVSVGTTLFLGEWIFGSIGWGVLHGALAATALVVVLLLAVVQVRGRWLLGSLGLAVLIGLLVGLILGFDLPNIGWTRLGEGIAPGLLPEYRPLIVASAAGGIVGAVSGLLIGYRAAGRQGALAGLIGLGLVGALAGAFTSIPFGARVGAALGVTTGLIIWPILAARPAYRGEIDWERQKARFWPNQTIETTQESIEWLQQHLPSRPKL